jgi:soluble lytic murein transglycosylase-like protein
MVFHINILFMSVKKAGGNDEHARASCKGHDDLGRPSSFPARPLLMPRSPAARRCLRWRPLLSSATAYVLLIIGPVTNAQEFTGKPPIVCATADGFAAFVAEAAQRFGIPATWIRIVMRAESFGEVRAISPKGARA